MKDFIAKSQTALLTRKDTLYICSVMVWTGRSVAGVHQFALKQIKEKTAAVSASQIQVYFFQANKISAHSQYLFFSLNNSLTHPYLYSVMWATRNTSIAHIQIAALGNKIGSICFLARFKYSALNSQKPMKAWTVSNESLKNYLLNYINKMYK